MLVGVSAAIMFGVVALSVITGQMAFFTRPLAAQAAPAATAPVGAAPASAAAAAAAASSQAAPAFDTALIKGYMSMAEVVQATGIPAEEFVAAFGVTEAEFSAPLKEVKAAHNWDTQAVRDFVADRLGVARSAPEGCE
jgi:hypothetical protein